MDLVLVLTTMPDDNRADELAQSLVDERLAACVNVHGPMISTYRWKGQVEHEAERQVVIKTTRARLPELGLIPGRVRLQADADSRSCPPSAGP